MLTTLLLCISCVNIFASTFFNASPSHTKKTASLKKIETFYTNFSGLWKSPKCLGSYDMNLKIRHNEDFILVDTSEAPIGALQTTSTAGTINLRFQEPTASIYSIEWSNNHTQLIFMGVNVLKPVDRRPSPSPIDRALQFTIHHNTIALNQEGQLLFKMKGVEYRDLQLIDEWDTETCVFNKISEYLPDKNPI